MTCDSSSLSDRGRDESESLGREKARRPWSVRLQPAPAPHLPVAFHQSFYSRPSPKKAAIRSPLKTTTGLDSHKLEQNNLFLSPYLSPLFLPSCLPIPVSALSPVCPSLPVPIRLGRQRRREPRALPGATRFPCCLRMCAVLMRAEFHQATLFFFFLVAVWARLPFFAA